MIDEPERRELERLRKFVAWLAWEMDPRAGSNDYKFMSKGDIQQKARLLSPVIRERPGPPPPPPEPRTTTRIL